jgi:hypothetical protein
MTVAAEAPLVGRPQACENSRSVWTFFAGQPSNLGHPPENSHVLYDVTYF